MSRIVTLDAPIGGLGDALLFSTLPQRFGEIGAYVGVTPRTLENCRNAEVRELLYKRNPWIKEIIPAEDADEVIGIPKEREFFFAARQALNPIDAIEETYGFCTVRDKPATPVVYYKPQFRHEFADMTVIDPCSISQAFPAATFEAFYERLLLPFEDNAVVLTSSGSGTSGRDTLASVPRYQVRDIYEYLDIVYSAYSFVCTESGSQSLASAVREERTYALCTTMMFNSRFYIWPNVNYTVTGQLSGDYLWNDTSAQDVGRW